MLVEELQVVMQTTEGYASHLSGCTERGHRTDGDMVRSLLYSASLGDEYWCFALMYSAFIARRWCNYPQIHTPYEKWHGKKPSYSNIHIFGTHMHTHNHHRKRLDALSSPGKFLGYGASTAVIYYLDSITNKIKRTHHARIHDLNLGASTSPASTLICKHASFHDIQLPHNISTLQTVKSPFEYHTLFSYDVTVPPSGPLGIILENDTIFGLPIISYMHEDSPFRMGCKKILQKNAWIVGIHYDEPITKERFMDYIQYLRNQQIYTFKLTLTKRINQQATNYETYRNYCDNFRPISSKSEFVFPEVRFAVQTPKKPPTPLSWTDVKQSPFRDAWYKAVMERYDKNHIVGLFSSPIPIEDVPEGSAILRAVSVFKIKTTTNPGIFDFYFRLCADGSGQIQGIHFEHSHSPTPAAWVILVCIAIAAAHGLTIYTIDIDNAFQNTPRYSDQHKPIYVTLPPLYLQWMKSRFPAHTLKQGKRYVLQCYMNMQGMKSANRDFHTLLKSILSEENIHPTSVDNGLFVFYHQNSLVLLAISTDDLLVVTKHKHIYTFILNKLRAAFGTTTQSGSIIRYLNYRIIQSVHAISIDQTEFIQGLLPEYFPPNSKVAKTNTPLRSDKQFNEEIISSIPASPNELKRLALQYKGDYRTIFGKICHVMKASRPDLSNAVNRLGVFQSAPNELAFKSIYKTLQYLHTHPNVPLVFPRENFQAESIFQCHSTAGRLIDSIKIPHCYCCHVDMSFAPHKTFRHSVGGHVETILGVAIAWKTMKQTSCATSATDGETRQYYEAAKRAVRMRNLFSQIGLTIPTASPIFPSFSLNYKLPTCIFEDNKRTRDMLAAGKVTSNLKQLTFLSLTCTISTSQE